MPTKPLVSIVCGTYNRLNSLKAMLDSIETTIPDSIPYEVVIVDNASTDGTWQWLTTQSERFNLTLMDMGKPVGAIKAFTEGAYKASGQYVLLATDDIQFPPYAITRAISHLEESTNCGAVAFAHNKRRDQFKVDLHPVQTEDGKRKSYPYPQISLVRKWLGDMCGWWGGRHTIMQNAFTYGGDNFLGASIIEQGYSIDAVEGCNNLESVFEDEPRKMNVEKHKVDAELFHSCFPNLPTLRTTPQANNPDVRKMRILYLNQFTPKDAIQRKNKRGLKEALQRVGHTWEVDYVAFGKQAPELLCAITRAWQPHLILMQVHRTDIINGAVIRAMRNEAPHTVIVNRIGDVYADLHMQDKQLQAWQQCDGLLVCNAKVIEPLQALGVPAFYWAHSFESVDDPLPDMPAHDVVFLGNGYDEFRKHLGLELKSLQCDVGLYGKGHIVDTNGKTHYDFSAGRSLYKNAKIAISDQHFQAYAYTSNRFWEILGAGGALILHQKTDSGIDEMTGLKEDTHFVTWTDIDDLKRKIHYWLQDSNQERRCEIVRNAHRQAQNHSFDARVKQLLLEIIPQLAERVKTHELVTV